MVSVSYPFITTSKEKAYKSVELANHNQKLNGCFVHYCTTSTCKYLYFLYEFHESLRASDAKLTDFTVQHQSVETDKIFYYRTREMAFTLT